MKDGEMRMYKMEKEVDGVMCDPLKAVHSVKVGFITEDISRTTRSYGSYPLLQ